MTRGGVIVLAHSVTPGGPDIEVLLLSAALLYLGVYLFVRKAAKPYVAVLLVLGAVAAAMGAFALCRTRTATTNATVSITAPREGAVVDAGRPVPIKAAVKGGRITSSTQTTNPNAGHLHVYVDGKLTAMPTTSTYRVKLTPGSHTVTVEFTRADHISFSPRVFDRVDVTAR